MRARVIHIKSNRIMQSYTLTLPLLNSPDVLSTVRNCCRWYLRFCTYHSFLRQAMAVVKRSLQKCPTWSFSRPLCSFLFPGFFSMRLWFPVWLCQKLSFHLVLTWIMDVSRANRLNYAHLIAIRMAEAEKEYDNKSTNQFIHQWSSMLASKRYSEKSRDCFGIYLLSQLLCVAGDF